MNPPLLTELKDGIARMTVNRPDVRNAMSGAIMQDMLAFCRGIEGDPGARVLVITGAGEHFMAGGDVKSFHDVIDRSEAELRANFEQRSLDAAPLWLMLERLPQPVVCSVRGFAAGAALSFVAGSDITLASDNAQFLLAHVGIGLCPDAGTSYHLTRAVGTKKAKELAFLGDRIDAQEALRLGLVNRVVPDAELDAETEKLVQRLARAPSIAIREGKKLMNQSLNSTLSEQLSAEGISLAHCGASQDFKEGVRAFVEKRKARFGGK